MRAEHAASELEDSPDLAPDLVAELEALQTRQVTLLAAVRGASVVDEELLAKADAIFGRAPEYVAKLRQARSAMDELAVRTAGMRERLEMAPT